MQGAVDCGIFIPHSEKKFPAYNPKDGFSKEILERHKKEVGPIFSIKDELGEYYPAIWFELYSNNYWICFCRFFKSLVHQWGTYV